MTVKQQITEYIAAQPERKRTDMQALHRMMLRLMPGCRLWFLDGKDERGRTVSNPSIGYGIQAKTYADGSTREFYQIGVSANTTGISVYVMGLADKKHLAATYGKALGKAKVTGYCIKFRTLSDIEIAVLEAAVRNGIEQTSA
jgi:hypothetical protein